MANILFKATVISMVVYLALNILTANKYQFKNSNKCIIFVLWFFAVFRGNGDGDYFNYLEYSKYISSLEMLFNNRFPMEFGFRFFAFIINLLEMSPQFIFIFMNSIISLTVYKLIGKEFKPLNLLFYLYFYLQFDIHSTRTGVALVFGLLFLVSYVNKENLLALCYFLISFLFHKSALILVLIPITFYIVEKFEKKILIKYFLFVLLFFAIFDATYIILCFLKAINLNMIAARMNNYLNSELYGYALRIYDPRILYFMYIFIYKMNVESEDYLGVDKEFLLLSFLNIMTLLIFRRSVSLALRLSSYFGISQIVFPVITDKFSLIEEKRNYKSIYSEVIIVAILVLFTIYLVLRLPEYRFFS